MKIRVTAICYSTLAPARCSIDAEDAAVLREVGAHIRANGYPEAENIAYPEVEHASPSNDE